MLTRRLAVTALLVCFALGAAFTTGRAERAGGAGLYTTQQAAVGAREYATYCASCHGADLSGPQAPLRGPAFTSLGTDQGMSLATFFAFIVRDTPAGNMGSLSHEQYVAIMAFLLKENGYVAGSKPLRFGAAMHLTQRIAQGGRNAGSRP